MPNRRQKKIITNDEFVDRTGGLRMMNGNKEANQEKNKSGFKGGQRKKINKLRVKNLTAPKVKNFKATIKSPATAANQAGFSDDKAERKNRLIMWTGIGSLMAVFFIIWIFNLKSEFNKASANKSVGQTINWSQTKVELDRAVQQVKQGLAEVRAIQDNLKPNALPNDSKLTPEQINLLKGKLLNEVAAETASSTVK